MPLVFAAAFALPFAAPWLPLAAPDEAAGTMPASGGRTAP